MPKVKRPRREPTNDWQQVQQYTLWPEQRVYELIRPVVLYGEPATERAKTTGENERAIYRKAERFDAHGMLGLFPQEPAPPTENPRSLPPPMRQLIVDLRAELPTMHLREIANICYLQFGRRPSHHTIKQVLAAGPPPSITTRRYPPYAEMHDATERRLAIVRLHVEGWHERSIAIYLQTTRRRVSETLQRWAEEQFAGLPDKSHVPKHPPRKTTLAIANEIRKLQENPELGEWRVHAALLQMGITISPRTCGRIMAQHRALYGLERPKAAPKSKKEMPFKAQRRHEFWSIDVRYIEQHQLPDISGPVYVISVLENFSRALLASTLSKTQDLMAYLMVLFAAFRKHGVPEAIVTDGGAIFYANQALHVYKALGIRKERITPRQAWENYIETHFSIMRRMADYHFAHAQTWEEMLSTHTKFVQDYNYQHHWGHRERQDGRHSPAEVLGWVQGVVYPEAVLDRVLYAMQFARSLDRHGYLRFRHWRLYAERGLAGEAVVVWLHAGLLKVEYQAVPLALYSVEFFEESQRIRAIKNPRLIETHFRSPQLALFELGPDEWCLFMKLPEYAPRMRRRQISAITQLSLFPENLASG